MMIQQLEQREKALRDQRALYNDLEQVLACSTQRVE